ncbi:MAG: SBBP repeat-containing protein [Betaproteobacteria bacterium]
MKRTSRLPHSRPFARRKLALLVAVALSGTVHAHNADLIGIPISFERNDGQFPAEVLFVSRGLQGTVALASGEVAITPRRDALRGREPVRLRLAGANLAPEVEPLHALATRGHHYVGNVNRIENVPHFGELQMRDVYPGIDMVLHGRDGALEYDLVVAPGADPNDIRIDLRGADRIALDAQGNLQLVRGDETLTQHAPVAYQGEGAQRRAVDARFELVEGAEGPEARVALGAYDPAIALTVDPVIGYSTYVGSSGDDGGTIVRVDPQGNLYYTQLGASGSVDAVVVSKLDPVTNTLQYQTSFGGHGFNTGSDIALGGAVSTTAFVVGTTRAADFPVVPLKPDGTNDAFVAVLAPDGTLTNTRLLGGSGTDNGTSIALDAAGNVYVAGTTASVDFPVTVGPGINNGLGSSGGPFPGIVNNDGFVAKLDPSTLASIYVRYVGGSGDDRINDLAVDASGQAIVAGTNFLSGFPQVNVGSPASPAPPSGQPRGFAAKLSGDGASYVFAEYVGGTSFSADSVAFDPSTGDAVVGGSIGNNGLVPASTRPFGGGFDAYIVRLDAVGNPTFASYLGGSGNDLMGAVAVDHAGTVFVTGSTRAANFPVVDGLPGQTAPIPGTSNAFVTRFTAGTIDFSSYLGGSGNDNGTSLAIGVDGALYVGGFTSSVDFPTVNPFRATRQGRSDGFITQIPGVAAPTPPTVPGVGIGGAPGLGGAGPPGLGGGGPPGLGGGGPPGRGR